MEEEELVENLKKAKIICTIIDDILLHIDDLDTVNYQYEECHNALVALQSAIIKKLEKLEK